MQFLQMAQKVRQLVGMQGNGPSSVSATGAEGLFLANVQDAWEDLQNAKKYWKWMRSEKSFNLAIGITTYTLLTIFGPGYRFKRWLKDCFYITVSGTKRKLRFIPYERFKYLHMNDTTNSLVYEFTISPSDNSLIFNRPNDLYTIDCGYQKGNQSLVGATDVPELPVDYHMLIVYDAVNRYANTVQLPQDYSMRQAELFGMLLRDQNPEKIFRIDSVC